MRSTILFFLLTGFLAAACVGCDSVLEEINQMEETAKDSGNAPPPPPKRKVSTGPSAPAPDEPVPYEKPDEEEPAETEEPTESPVQPPEMPAEPEPENDLPIPEEPMTVEQARQFIETIGGRVGLDEQNRVVKVFLNRTQAGDEQIRALKYLPDLEIVNLSGSRATDQCVESLSQIPHLKRLYPVRTEMTETGFDELQAAHPDMEILY